jgi:DNA invertase Pin-like site-specific DNA recombinase
MCRLTGATLVIAKLDRLSRNVAFLANLMNSSVEFVACDNPHATRFTTHILAAVAEHEREMISQRTKVALRAAKARGEALGGDRGYRPNAASAERARQARSKAADTFAAGVGPIIREMRETGCSLRQVAGKLAERGIRTSRGGGWTADAVRQVLLRTGAAAAD